MSPFHPGVQNPATPHPLRTSTHCQLSTPGYKLLTLRQADPIPKDLSSTNYQDRQLIRYNLEGLQSCLRESCECKARPETEPSDGHRDTSLEEELQVRHPVPRLKVPATAPFNSSPRLVEAYAWGRVLDASREVEPPPVPRACGPNTPPLIFQSSVPTPAVGPLSMSSQRTSRRIGGIASLSDSSSATISQQLARP
jgi:hypothetical protein